MGSSARQTLIVLPAFNEEASISEVLREVREALPGVPCLVVNDGSSDGTALIAERAGALVATLPFNLGVGGAMRVGFKYALANRYSTVVQIDSDGQHDPGDAWELIEALGSADVVLGARFAGEGAYTVRGPRRWAMTVLARIISRSSRTLLTDVTSGFRASGPKAIMLFAEHYPAEYLGDTIESLVIAARSGCVIRQVPVAMRPRSGGVPSHNLFKSTAYLGRVVLALVFALIRPSSSYQTGDVQL